jgi:hypothetical protein
MAPGVLRRLAVTALATLAVNAATLPARADVIVKQGTNRATLSIVEALSREAAAKGSAPKVVDLTGSFSTDLARVGRAASGTSILYAVGPRATVLAGTVAESRKGAHVVSLAVPNPERLKTGAATFVSFYPRLDSVFRFLGTRFGARDVGFLYSPSQNAAVSSAFAKAAAGRGMNLRAVEVHSAGDLVRGLKQALATLDVLLLPVDPILFEREQLRIVIDEARRARKPAIGFLADLPQLGFTGALVNSEEALARTAFKASRKPAPDSTVIVDVEGPFVYVTAEKETVIDLDSEKPGEPKSKK